MERDWIVKHEGTFVKEVEYRRLVECSEEDASLFTEEDADSIVEYLGGDAEKIKVKEY